MDITNHHKEKLLRAMIDYKEGPDGANGLYRMVLDDSITPEERSELVHEAINLMNDLTMFVDMMRRKN